MAFVYDTKAQAGLGTGDPITLAYTCGAGTKLLVVAILGANDVTRLGGAPTYNAVAMTQAGGTITGSLECTTELWYLVNPPTGSSYNVSVPNSDGLSIRIEAFSFTSTGGTPTLFGNTSTDVSIANPQLTINSVPDGSCVVSVLGSGYKDSVTGRSHTELYTNDEGAWVNASQYEIKSGTGNTTHSFTQPDDDVAMIMAAWKETAAPLVISPDAASCVVAKVDPTVVYGSVSITPPAASAVATVVKPGVVPDLQQYTGYRYPHATLYHNGYLYVGCYDADNHGHLLKINASDLEDFSVADFPETFDYLFANQIRYSSSKNKLYVLFSATKVILRETDPDTLAQSDVINDATYSVTSGSFAHDESFMYIAAYTSNKILKYDMSDWSLDSSADIAVNGHAVEYDDGYVYVTHLSSPGSVTKVDVSDLSLSTQAFTSGYNGPTDDFAVVGDYAWCGLEGTGAGQGQVVKIAKSDLSLTYLDVRGSEKICYGVRYDGTYLWAVYSDGILARITPATSAHIFYDLDLTNANEILFNNGLIFLTNYVINFSVLKTQESAMELAALGYSSDVIALADEVDAQIIEAGTLNAAVYDDIGLTDETGAELTLYEIAPYDSLDAGDSVAAELTIYEVAVNDAVTVTDDVQAVPSPQISAADDVGLTDEGLAQLNLYEIAVDDEIAVAEDIAGALTLYEIAPYDSIGLQDEVSASVISGLLLEVSVFDLVHIHPAYRRPDVSDFIGLTDAVSASIPILLASVYDSVSVTDDAQAEIPLPATVDVTTYDDLAVTDEPEISIPVFIVSVFDNVAISDETENSLTLYEALAYDALDVLDEPTLQLVGAGLLPASVEDAVGLTDEVSLSIPVLAISVSDSIGLQDSAEASLNLYQTSLFDQIDVTDYVESSLIGAGIQSINVADDLAVTDAIALSIPVLSVSVGDSLGLTDATAISLPVLLISVADSVLVYDEPAASINVFGASVSDDIGVSDAAQAQIPVLAIMVNDSVAVTDTGTTSIPILWLSVSDAIGLQDSAEASLTLYEIPAYDSIGISEYVEVQLFGAGLLALNVNDTIGLTDSTGAGLTPYLLTVADDLAITDSAASLLTIYELIVFDSVNVGEFCQLSIPGLVLEPYVSETMALTDSGTVAIAIYPFLQATLNVKANESVLTCRDTGSVVDVVDTGTLLTVTR